MQVKSKSTREIFTILGEASKCKRIGTTTSVPSQIVAPPYRPCKRPNQDKAKVVEVDEG